MDVNDPARMVTDDFGEMTESPYCHGVPLPEHERIADKRTIPDLLAKHDGLKGSILGSSIGNRVSLMDGKL